MTPDYVVEAIVERKDEEIIALHKIVALAQALKQACQAYDEKLDQNLYVQELLRARTNAARALFDALPPVAEKETDQ